MQTDMLYKEPVFYTELIFITLAGGSPAVVLAICTGLSLIVLSACTVKIPQHTVAGRFVLAWIGLTKV